MRELNVTEMESIVGGNRCSNYDNAIATTGLITAGIGLALATGGTSLVLSAIGFGLSYASVLSCNGVGFYR
ncbi:hypothetical protein [Lunatimonas lonarensis]|uniref:hypothetical protein n=1 Tax=Lunatimonas lonarensis TaxID=1232681 RepID=UPI0012DFE3BE|nr:hypothetical protein [Lunatimonas lonarensis]